MSSDVAIRTEGLGKVFRLGTTFEPRLTLREQINRLALAPYHRMKAVMRGESAALSGDDLWALKDVSLSVTHGEVVGVIGRNGAGKSTLLKILSRITEPTRGRAEIHGRVGSLLEVGTGFHSELTGRENVFLNGVILGMSHTEIAKKFDEIVAFAEVERFLDTQVKHYSSGMSLRLAFAVAAHLQPEILLIDEVLAVGDAAFQRKCLGKMSDVAYQGRAILFVSHNLEAVQRLCDRCIWIDGGQIRAEGSPDTVVRAYLEHGDEIDSTFQRESPSQSNAPIALRSAALYNAHDQRADTVCFGEPFSLRFSWDVVKPIPGSNFVVHVRDVNERLIFAANTHGSDREIKAGRMETTCRIRENVLRPGDYSVTVICERPPRMCLDRVERCIRVRVLDVARPGRTLVRMHREAIVAPEVVWDFDSRDTQTAGLSPCAS